MPYIAKVSPKGWVVIPKKLRDRYGLAPGSKVLMTETDNGLTINVFPGDPVKSFKGLLKHYPLLEELQRAKREETFLEELRAGQLRPPGLPPE
ncbi:MAG: AbrB/MazE/SpoVT family DNA-binding domain-containing protein [Desulfotomaculales bacterium]